MNFIDEKHLGLYSEGSEDKVNDNVDLDTNTTETITNIQELILKELPDNLYTDSLYCMNGDCNERLKLVKDKTIQTICIDPPYNIGKDTWDNIDNYNEWLTNIVITLEKKLRDNGSMFIFHNDMEAISELMVSIKQKTKLKFVQMITWNKRYEGSKKERIFRWICSQKIGS